MNIWTVLWMSYWNTIFSLSVQFKRNGVVYGTDVSSGHVGPDNVVSLALHPKYVYHQPGELAANGQQQASHL